MSGSPLSPSPGSREMRQAQLLDYGCMAHPHGGCPEERRVAPSWGAPIGSTRYCVPAIPAPADLAYAPPPTPFAIPPSAVALAPAELAAAVAPISAMEVETDVYPPEDVMNQLEARGCDFGAAPWESGSPHYGPPGSCLNHPYGMCPSENPFSYYVDRRRRLGLPYTYTGWDSPPYPGPRTDPPKKKRKPTASKAAAKSMKRMAKKGKRATRKVTSRARSKASGLDDMSALAAALLEQSATAVSGDDLSELLRKVSLGGVHGRRVRSTRRRSSGKKN
jgi:hypothetical protein